MCIMQLHSRKNIKYFLYGILTIGSGVARWFIHIIMTIIYRGKGETVPRIQNPLLLKSATKLAEEISKGKLKSEDVVQAYIERILEVEPYINATVERCFEDALLKAREVDNLVASGKYTYQKLADDKPFLGVPITVKVLLTVKGLRSTAGCKLFKDLRATEDCSSVSLMKRAGAIVIATTNVPEGGLHLDTNNFVHGQTRNPYDTNRTSGASSGGESALISAGGSVLGLGNDLIGSIRLPCHFTGIFGHKPTVGLVPNEGCFPVPDRKLEKFLQTGPMCRYAEDLITSMKVLSSQFEPRVIFGQTVNFKKIKIFYMTELQDVLVTPVDKEISLALRKAVSHFQTHYGSAEKEVEIPFMEDINRCVMHIQLSSIEDIKATITAGKGNHINEKIDYIKYFFGKSFFSHGPLVVLNFLKSPILYSEKRVPFYEEQLEKLAKEFDNLLDENSVFLFPTFPISAPYQSETLLHFPSVGYTSIFNLLGLPSTQCPLGFNKNGLPFGIQIIGRKNNDSLTIACAVELGKAFGGWVPPGNTQI